MNKKIIILFLHVLFWVQNMTRNILFIYEKNDPLRYIIYDQMVIASICYLNYFFLTPYILKKNKLSYYILGVFIFITGFTVLYSGWIFSQPYLLGIAEIKDAHWVWIISFNISFLYGAMSSGSRFAVDWIKNQDKNKTLQLQKNNRQIQFIKSNINIPFLLETLNYSENLAKHSPQQAGEPIMLLSNVLRYSLYESESEKISLEREIEILKEYISLQNQVDKNIVLALHINIHNNLYIMPNSIIRFIGIWKSILNKLEIKGIQNILLLDDDHKTVMLRLPINENFHHYLSDVQKQFPTFSNEHFNIDYFIEKHCLCLKSTNLNV